jgi:hypothetical protein
MALALPLTLGMPRQLSLTLLLGALAAASCTSSVERTAADKIREFQERADTGRLAEIRRDYTPSQGDWEKMMQRRQRLLGRLQRTSSAQVEDISSRWGVITLWYNSEFEHGRALETFQFKVVDGVPRLIEYGYDIGTNRECSITGCKDVNVAEKSASLSR